MPFYQWFVTSNDYVIDYLQSIDDISLMSLFNFRLRVECKIFKLAVGHLKLFTVNHNKSASWVHEMWEFFKTVKNRKTDQKCLKRGEIVCVRASAQRRNHRPRIGRRIPSLASENPARKNVASDDFSNFISLGPLATHHLTGIRHENVHGGGPLKKTRKPSL